jgi:putative pyrroloquinoline-quinone binding quinoprotein
LSQQSPSPNQPPGGGGFGPPTPAPGTPPSAPPLPPAGRPGQPGYGYPRQSQPQQQPALSPYGPAQPSPPTGAFGAAAAPGPYGPPPATPLPSPPSPPPSGGAKGGLSGAQLALVISAVLALLLAGGGAVWLLTGSDDGSTTASDEPGGGEGTGREDTGGEDALPAEPVDASLDWRVPRPDVSAEDVVLGARGVWFSGETVVRAIDDAITAWHLETGEEAWSIPLELSGGDCNASPTASDDRIAVLQGRDCEVLTVIDISAGEEITSIPLDGESAGSLDDTNYPALLGDTVALGSGTTGVGYDITTGEQIWGTSPEENCPEVAFAVVDETFVSQRSCGWVGDEGGSIRATTEGGEELWEWEYGTEYQGEPLTVHSVLSVEPLVVTAWLDDEPERESIFVIDENHEEIAHALDYDPAHYVSPCQINTLNDCKASVVHDGFLYLTSETPGSESTVVAFELSSGQALYEVEPVSEDGETPSADSYRRIRPFAAVDGRILAYQRDGYDDTVPGMVVAIDPATEEARPVMRLDPAASAQEHAAGVPSEPQDLRLLWHEGSLLMLTESFHEGDLEDRDAILAYR